MHTVYTEEEIQSAFFASFCNRGNLTELHYKHFAKEWEDFLSYLTKKNKTNFSVSGSLVNKMLNKESN